MENQKVRFKDLSWPLRIATGYILVLLGLTIIGLLELLFMRIAVLGGWIQ